MQPLNLPTYLFNTKSENGKTYIFDSIRRKFILLTPEEWVRQNFIRYLNEEKKIPLGFISVEKGFRLHKLHKRTDILLHDRSGNVRAIVECKAPEVAITTSVFDQILRYNLAYLVPYIIITNGLNHYCCILDHQTSQYQFLKDIPDYDEMTMNQ
jgi:type I site-specific restriction endonuclease